MVTLLAKKKLLGSISRHPGMDTKLALQLGSKVGRQRSREVSAAKQHVRGAPSSGASELGGIAQI